MNLRSIAPSLFAALASFAALAAAACSHSPPDPATACADFARAECEQIARYSPVQMDVLYGGSVDTCAASDQPFCNSAFTISGSGATPAWVEGCAQAIGTQACTDTEKPLAACTTPPGTLPNGAACYSNEQCSGGECYGSAPGAGTTTACGTCTKAPAPAPSSGCMSDSDCPGEEVCAAASFASDGGVLPTQCVAPLQAGATCGGVTPTPPCRGGLACLPASNGGTSVCTAPGSVGQACLECSGSAAPVGTCATNLVCANGTCQTPQVVSIGGACGGATQICSGSQCLGGVCVAYATQGSPCGGLRPACASPLECENQVCVLPIETPPTCK